MPRGVIPGLTPPLCGANVHVYYGACIVNYSFLVQSLEVTKRSCSCQRVSKLQRAFEDDNIFVNAWWSKRTHLLWSMYCKLFFSCLVVRRNKAVSFLPTQGQTYTAIMEHLAGYSYLNNRLSRLAELVVYYFDSS